MPRNAKDSDDEIEAKSGRRTRAALNPSVLDSPLRRSTRIKQPAQQDGSSPDSVSDISSSGTNRSTRRKTLTGDAGVTEPTKSSRIRRTSVASDISELTETESLPDGPPKRVTRRSVASVAAVETPPAINGRTRRGTRAGSESKSTPPVGRTTRRNRASSLEPETMEEQIVREVGTPVKSKRRASALPSEPAVAEESEDSGRAVRRGATKTVYEVDEDAPESPTLDTSKSSRRKSKNDAIETIEKMDVVESSESPTAGANDEEATNVSEEKRRKSTSNVNEDQEKNVEFEEKSAENDVEGNTVHQSDDESEYDGYPAFKDIPADEWTGADTEKTDKNTNIDTNSVHSASTEQNGSEFDFELVDKEFQQGSEKEDHAKSDYDSDDTVKIAVASSTSVEPKDDEKRVNPSTACVETPMDVSSDEEETDIKANASIKSTLDTSRKINAAKTPNKNTSLIADTSAKGSPIGLNSSRRKSLLSVDDQSNDNANTSTKMNRSMNNSLKKNRLNVSALSEEENNSDNSGEAAKVVATPKMISRKSLDASAKKSKNTPVSSKTIGSAKNTPSNAEKKANETSAKRNRSLTKSATSLPSDDTENSFDNTAGSEPMIEENVSAHMSKHALQIALKEQLNPGSPAKTLSDVFSSAHNSPASPKIGKKRSSLNESDKNGSAKKPAKAKNSSKSEMVSSESSDVEEESQEGVSSPKILLNESRKSASAKKSMIDKNNWMKPPTLANVIKSNLDSPASPEPGEKGLEKFAKLRKPIKIPSSSEKPRQGYEDSLASPDPKDKGHDISAKSRSANKSANKNTWRSADDSESETDNRVAPENLNTSAKIGSAKKSANCSRSSTISSDSVADDEDSQENCNRSRKSLSAKKSTIYKNHSTIAQVNSDSDANNDVTSDDTSDDADISRKIPAYLFDYSSESNSCISSKSIDSDVERDMNLHGKSALEYSDDDVPADDCMATDSESSDGDDDGADLMDFVVDEEEDFSDVEHDLGHDDDESHESLSETEKKPRKRIIPRPPRDSDSDDSEEEEPPTNVSSRLDKSNTTKTPIKPATLNKTQENPETETKHVDLNVSAKNIPIKNKSLLIQCSTPKTVARQSLLLEQSNSTKATTPLSESAKMVDSPVKLKTPGSKKLSKSVCETIQTPAKPNSSFKLTKTPKTSVSMQEQLQTSLPADLNKTADRTNLSKMKSTKLSMLNRTVVPPGSESPEIRFLMVEKLNESMPALKLQQRAKALRRSIFDNLREGIQATEQVPEEIYEMQKQVVEEQMSLSEKEATRENEVSSEKKKKKKKHASECPEEMATSLIESAAEVNDDSNTSAMKSKKLKKKKFAEPVEQAETKPEEISKKKKEKNEEVVNIVVSEDADKKGKKKKKKQEEIIENVVVDELDKKERKKKKIHEAIIENIVLDQLDKKERKKKKKHEEIVEKIVLDEVDKNERKKKKLGQVIEKVELDAAVAKKRKKKDRKLVEATEPEVPALSQKSRRIAAQNDQNSGSDEPEAMDFAVAREAALRDLRKVTESIKAGQEAKKKKHQENLALKQERKAKTRPEVAGSSEKIKTSVKRLSDDILANLSDVPERPKKRRKVNREEIAPSKTTFSPLQTKSGNFQVDDGYIPLSSVGGTTQFTVVNLKKAAKHSKKAVAASTFRERMLARNPRQPVSAYLMYKQKQKHTTGADCLY